jgi:uncharacterized membrane protein
MLSFLSVRYAYIGQPFSLAAPLAFHTIFSWSSLYLILAYFLPFAFLPLLVPKWVIPALIILLSEILSTDFGQHGMLLQYPAAAVPFLFLAFIEMLPRTLQDPQIQSFIKMTHNRAIIYSLVPIVVICLMLVSGTRIKLASLPDAHDVAINQVIALIPDNESVTASNDIFPHLCARTDTYLDAWEGEAIAPTGGIINEVWGFPENNTEYVLFDVGNDTVMASNISKIMTQYTLIKNINGVMLYQLNH